MAKEEMKKVEEENLKTVKKEVKEKTKELPKTKGDKGKKENKENKKNVEEEQLEIVPSEFDPYKIIKYPLSTEKSIRQIEFDNKLSFVVHSRATKRDVKKAVEELFKVKVVKVNIQNSFTGQKRAYVKLSAENVASDVSADLGLI